MGINQRKAERFSMLGNVHLTSGDKRLVGRVLNISTGGMALVIALEAQAVFSPRKTWMCRVYSADLPAPAEFLAKVVRSKTSDRYGFEIACQITAINEQSLGFIKAYQALMRARSKSVPGLAVTA